MNFQLVPIEDNELEQYKADMQEAFQKGYEEEFGQSEETILPVKDIDHSLNRKGSVAYKALVDGKMAGGAIVVIDNETQHNYLDFLFVKYGTQSMGIGKNAAFILFPFIMKKIRTPICRMITPVTARKECLF